MHLFINDGTTLVKRAKTTDQLLKPVDKSSVKEKCDIVIELLPKIWTLTLDVISGKIKDAHAQRLFFLKYKRTDLILSISIHTERNN
jgi:hypothetical protein